MASVEKIASRVVDEDGDEDAAWLQIIRDLEDVGISQQDALQYWEFVTDWFVRAVKEGILMEQRAEPNLNDDSSRAFDDVSRELIAALPVPASPSV